MSSESDDTPEKPQTSLANQQKPKKKRWGWGVAAVIITGLGFSGVHGSQSNLNTDTSIPTTLLTQSTDSSVSTTDPATELSPTTPSSVNATPNTAQTPPTQTTPTPSSGGSYYTNVNGNSAPSPSYSSEAPTAVETDPIVQVNTGVVYVRIMAA